MCENIVTSKSTEGFSHKVPMPKEACVFSAYQPYW